MRRIAIIGLSLLLALPAGGARAGDGADIGTLVGAGLGGLIGNQIGKGTGNIVATVAGVAIGGVVGRGAGRNWNGGYDDGQRYASTTYYAPQPVTYYQPNYVAPPAPTIVYTRSYYEQDEYPGRRYGHYQRHHRQQWQQPVVYQTQRVYSQSYVPVQDAAPEADAGYCREYTQRVVVGGRVQESYGTACLQPDGSWRVAQ